MSGLVHLGRKRAFNVLLALSPADEGGALLHTYVAGSRWEKHRRVREHGGCGRLERPLVGSSRLTRLEQACIPMAKVEASPRRAATSSEGQRGNAKSGQCKTNRCAVILRARLGRDGHVRTKRRWAASLQLAGCPVRHLICCMVSSLPHAFRLSRTRRPSPSATNSKAHVRSPYKQPPGARRLPRERDSGEISWLLSKRCPQHRSLLGNHVDFGAGQSCPASCVACPVCAPRARVAGAVQQYRLHLSRRATTQGLVRPRRGLDLEPKVCRVASSNCIARWASQKVPQISLETRDIFRDTCS